jgi:hypothetical protein
LGWSSLSVPLSGIICSCSGSWLHSDWY